MGPSLPALPPLPMVMMEENILISGTRLRMTPFFAMKSVDHRIGAVSLSLWRKGENQPPGDQTAKSGQEEQYPPANGQAEGFHTTQFTAGFRRKIVRQIVQTEVSSSLQKRKKQNCTQTSDDSNDDAGKDEPSSGFEVAKKDGELFVPDS